jgi:hypothetical protein
MFIVNHRIAGVTFCVTSDVPIPRLLNPAFSLFQVEKIQPDIIFRIRELGSSPVYLPPLVESERERLLKFVDFPPKWLNKTLLRSPDVWKQIETCLVFPEMANIFFRVDEVIIHDFMHSQMDFFYPSYERKEFYDPNNMMLLRWNMFGTFFINFSAFMLHGASVIRNDSALLFLGEDGGGKSTTMKLADRMQVLNDDQVVLRKENGVFKAHGTPFGRMTNGPLQAKLGGIFLLEKASHFSLSPASSLEAAQFIWNEHRFLWLIMPKSLKIKAFNLIVDACQQVRVFRMRFPKDFIDWKLVDQMLVV